jgi:transposase InsO family protein
VQDEKGYFWILTVLDHFTKHLWAEAFKTKEAPEIALWLLKTFRDGVVMPERWHADNGGEFINHHIDAVRELLAVNSDNVDGMMLPYSHSMPRNPQCQGLVERGNRTIKTTISKQMTRDGFKPEEHETWDWVPYLKREVGKLNRKVPATQPFVVTLRCVVCSPH